MAKIPAEIAARIDGYVTKYREMLKVAGTGPNIKLRNNPKDPWLGLTAFRLDRPQDIQLHLQKSILKDDSVLERAIAHEMIHYRDYSAFTEDDLDRIDAAGGLPDEEIHGASFHEGAARINAIMGPDFVTAFPNTEEILKFQPKAQQPEAYAELAPQEEGMGFGKKVVLALSLGFLGFAGVRYYMKQRAASVPTRSARVNERGNYGR